MKIFLSNTSLSNLLRIFLINLFQVSNKIDPMLRNENIFYFFEKTLKSFQNFVDEKYVDCFEKAQIFFNRNQLITKILISKAMKLTAINKELGRQMSLLELIYSSYAIRNPRLIVFSYLNSSSALFTNSSLSMAFKNDLLEMICSNTIFITSVCRLFLNLPLSKTLYIFDAFIHIIQKREEIKYGIFQEIIK